jgi:hypothetical protein
MIDAIIGSGLSGKIILKGNIGGANLSNRYSKFCFSA